jgi:UDP-N-acetylmuramyl tripeptide synthase
MKVTHNKTGANMLNGIVSAVLMDMNLLGKHNSEIGVFEVDENNLSLVLKYFSPNVLILLNLSRDQLDRYGEVDTILEKWIEALEKLESSTEIVLDSTQKYFDVIPESFVGEITYFDDGKGYMNKTPLVGNFNAKNVNAAVFSSMLLGVDEVDINNSLESFGYAYGRGELVKYKEKEYRILLAKNPASFNNNLDAINVGDVAADTLLFVFNDNIPDGRDVSWIYDIEHEKLKEVCEGKNIYVTGTRYMDMVVRLKYAGFSVLESKIFENIPQTLRAISNDVNSKLVLALPNYSAMLQLRRYLTGKSIL